MSKWKTKTVAIVLGLSILVPTAAFASGAVTAPADLSFNKFAQHERFNGEKGQAARDNILDLVSKYAPDSIEEWKKVIAEHEELMNALKEQAPPQRPEISDEVKTKLEAIREEVKNGTMTQEQASAKLKELGLARMGKFDQRRPEISDELKAKLEAIREEVKNGIMTQEQANAEFKELGLPVKRDLAGHQNLMLQLQEAVESNDKSTVQDLLAQLLAQLQEKNQQLSDKLAEIK